MKNQAENRAGLALENLQDLFVVCDRFSHSIRTHLGVSMGIIDDLCSGYQLKKEDYQDAQTAMKSILSTLDSVREITNPPSYQPELQALTVLLSDEGKREGGIRVASECLSNIIPETIDRPIDKKLFYRALRALILFGDSRLRRFAQQGEGGIKCQLFLKQQRVGGGVREELDFLVPSALAPDRELLAQATRWRDVSGIDQCPESLGLLFAERVFELHQGQTYFKADIQGNFHFLVVF